MKLHNLLASVALVFPLLVLAHGTEEHLRGVLKSKDASTLVIATSTGEARVAIDAKTRFESEGKSVTVDDARIGQRLVIHGSKRDGIVHATKVQLGAMETGGQKGQKP